MTSSYGYNPIKHDCKKSGCFNTVCRPKIEMFAEDLPGRIAMTDIDGTVEVAGCFLFFEWKSGTSRDIPTGQRIYFERLTQISPKIRAIAICGDMETMEMRTLCQFYKGKMGEWEATSLEAVKKRIRDWAYLVGKLKYDEKF